MLSPGPFSPSAALVAFAESAIRGRRVLWIGDALSGPWEQLRERGARLIHVLDSDSGRIGAATARGAPENVTFSLLRAPELALKEGIFEVGIIENLGALREPADTLTRMRQALSPRGVAYVACPNPEVQDALLGGLPSQSVPIDYYELYDLVRREFAAVRMLGQMPFVGYTVAELAPAEEIEPSIDASFVPGGCEEPEWYVAVGAARDVDHERYLVVQLPFEEFAQRRSERLLRDQLRAARMAERNAVERLARAESRILTEIERTSVVAEITPDQQEAVRLRQELSNRDIALGQQQARLDAERARAEQIARELEVLKSRLGSENAPDPSRAAESEDALGSWRERATRAEQAAATAEQRAQQLEQELNESRGVVARLSEGDPSVQGDLARLEQQLRERGQELRRVAGELKRAEQVGRELAQKLAMISAGGSGPGPQTVTDSWTTAAPLGASTGTTQHPAHASAWAEPVFEPTATSANAPAPNGDLERLCARYHADLVAAEWEIQRLQAALVSLGSAEIEAKNLRKELSNARERLQQAELSSAQDGSMHSANGPIR